ncbi:MAG: hypothetical protein GF330_07955 [Candidatus Eisenbacteria bacterium]|nr:hypothetical protein [Candidatus Eisenbacteria bacterium]
MRIPQRFRWAPLGALLLMVSGILLSQCILLPEEGFVGETVRNTMPRVEITGGVLEDSTDADKSRIHFYWYGADDDGVVRWFEWAIDDTVTEEAWTRTTGFDAVVPFNATTPTDEETRFSDWHTFFVRAVDNDGTRSRADRRYFNAHTIAPSSEIVSPEPEVDARWASTLRITWIGEDLDGSRADHLPAYFEYKLVRFESPPNPVDLPAVKRAFRDSTNVFFGDLSPGDYPADSLGDYFEQAQQSWVRVDGTEVSEAWLRNLDIGKTYGFALRAIDEAGAIEPEFVRNKNWVFFRITNERIRVTISEPSLGNETFNNVTFQKVWEVSVAPEQAIRFRWEGDASGTGSEPGPSNYGFDIPDPDDDAYRDANGIGGWIGWGNWTQMREAISYPRSDEGKTHYFYLKMRDVTNLYETETDCAVAIRVSKLSFSRKFLLLDDLYRAPSACVGLPPTDEETDAFRVEMLSDGMAEFLPAGETWGVYNAFGDETSGRPVELPGAFLDTLGTFQNVIWDCGSGQSVGYRDAVRRGFLSRYVGAGGNLFLYIHAGPVTNVFDCRHTQSDPCCPCESGCLGVLWERGTGFLWDLLRLQGCIDKPRDPTGDARRMADETLVRAEALNGLYPDLVLDPNRWVCGSFERGLLAFEGLTLNENEPADDPWYGRVADEGGLELLYRGRSLVEGAITDSLPVAWRTTASTEDSLQGFDRGRILTFAFHPYFFDRANLKTAMTYALRWVVTGAE